MPSSSANVDHTELFARIHIHGLAKSPTGEPRAVTLERRISFPMPVDISAMRTMTSSEIPDLSPRTLSPLFELEARVRVVDTLNEPAEERNTLESPGSLGQGRAGLVFPLDVLAIRHLGTAIPDDYVCQTDLAANTFLRDLPPLCVKVATPGYARALAREAWFYEQLDTNGLTGLVSPRCYGVFQAPLMGRRESTTDSDTDVILDIPGYDYHTHAQKPIYKKSQLFTARMIEERYDIKTNTLSFDPRFLNDSKESYTLSPWKDCRETPEATNLTVLIMDQLGERLTVEAFDASW